jgi:2-keto-3-deoxy-L-rhamnonate aldolase RhmA
LGCRGANRETFLTVQIETRAALANVEEMAKVKGVDIFFIGPGDLGWRLSKEGCGNTAVPRFLDFFPPALCFTTMRCLP